MQQARPGQMEPSVERRGDGDGDGDWRGGGNYASPLGLSLIERDAAVVTSGHKGRLHPPTARSSFYNGESPQHCWTPS